MRQSVPLFFAGALSLCGVPATAFGVHPWEAIRTAAYPEPQPWCLHVTHELYGNSSHPGGGGSLQERNGGWGGTCHLYPPESSWHVGLGVAGLTNSQNRTAGMVKVEAGWRPLHLGWSQVGYLVPEIGVMGGVLSYERKENRPTVLAPLMVPYYQVSWRYGSFTVGVRQIFLLDGVTLRRVHFNQGWTF
jgi:hypothetical protein